MCAYVCTCVHTPDICTYPTSQETSCDSQWAAKTVSKTRAYKKQPQFVFIVIQVM